MQYQADRANGSHPAVVDFDIHGVLGIRLLNPMATDCAAVEAQLGITPSSLKREPDIRIRFVPYLPTDDLAYVEYDRTGFTADDFFILRNRKHPVGIRIPFDRIGQPCEILCEAGNGPIPHLTAILGLHALQRDCVALHASAFEYEGSGVLVFGGAHAGKTSALLAFAEHGGRYVGDDTVLLTGDGQHMFGVSGQIELSHRHIEHAPLARRHVTAVRLIALRAFHVVDRALNQLLERASSWKVPARGLTSLISALRGRAKVSLPVARLFGEGPKTGSRPDKIFLMMAHQGADIRVAPTDADEIVERMLISIRHEGAGFSQDYLSYRFAFPDRTNEFIDQADERRRAILRSAMARMEAFVVRHPHGVALSALYAAMKPFCGRGPVFEAAGTASTLTEAADAYG